MHKALQEIGDRDSICKEKKEEEELFALRISQVQQFSDSKNIEKKKKKEQNITDSSNINRNNLRTSNKTTKPRKEK